jgi:hypothetical protein
MPDGTAGVAGGLYWVATGRSIISDLDEDEDEDLKGKPDDDDLDLFVKDRN